MNLLDQNMARVAARFRQLDWWKNVSFICFTLATLGLLLFLLQLARAWAYPGSGWILLGSAALATGLLALVSGQRYRSRDWMARAIEAHFPELEQRLITTLDEVRRNAGRPLGFLQHLVYQETLTHAHHNSWDDVVTDARIGQARRRGLMGMGLLLFVSLALMNSRPPRHGLAMTHRTQDEAADFRADFDIQVEPGNTEVEVGSNLPVIARFGKKMPKVVELVALGDSEETRYSMQRRLEDPLFGGSINSIQKDFEYYVAYDGERSDTFRVTTFAYPTLVRADALIEYPSYTGMEAKPIEDTRRVSAVEGSRVSWEMHLNKDGIRATLVPTEQGDGEEIPLQVDGKDPRNHLVSVTLTESNSWKLRLVDAEGRENRHPPTITVKVTPNRPPTLKLDLARDVRVSPLEEFLVKATMSDDYGLKRFGLNYTLASADPTDVILGQDSARREKKAAEHLLEFEALEASPDELLSYYFWAEDQDSSGNTRRLESDMFFAEVRHFEEIFREGEQPPGGQQQQQQQNQQSPNARDAEQLAELQKQIINATWRVIRREVGETVTPMFEGDLSTIVESQQTASEQLQELGRNLQDPESRKHLLSVTSHMHESLHQLTTAYSNKSPDTLDDAMKAQREAYQALLKLRAREHEVTQGRQQQGSPGSQGASRQQFQEQLQQLELQNDRNQYEAQRQAQEQEDQEQTELRQALSRLRELAQRQQDLNEQLKELQNALERAETEEERQEIERQLKRLREQQQEMLRDTDELMERLDSSENRETLQETREQLEETRERMRDSAESLERGEVTPALASGTRAQRELEDMREQLRRESANQFSEQMTEMRDKARELEAKQEEIGRRMGEQNTDQQGTGLRSDGPQDENLSDALREQNEQLQDLMREIEETVREAEESEPLLAENLYETYRQAEEDFLQNNLQQAADLTERGFQEPAQKLEEEARQGITRFRENVERAAESVLGDETDALRTAVRMLEDLERQLDEEISQFDQGSVSEGPDAQGRPRPEQRDDPSRSPDADQADARPGQAADQAESREQRSGQPSRRGPSSDDPRSDTEPRSPQPGQSPNQQGNQPGEPNDQQPPNEGQPSPQDGSQTPSQQSGESSGEQQESAESASPSDRGQPSNSQSESQQGGGGQAGDAEPQQDARQRMMRELRDVNRDPNPQQGGGLGGWESLDIAPITGDDFRQWSDRMRDVEEIVSDPELRAEATRIREQARAFRREFKRHSEEPKWDLVKELVSRPLGALRQRVSEELLRRSAEKNALIPLDRDPVPDQFSEQVRRYYENIGRGE